MAKLTFTGRIEFISAKENGTTKDGKEWEKYYIILADGEQHENKIKVECFNKKQEFKIGQLVECEITSRVNDYQGKHYMSFNLWSAKVEETKQQPTDDNDIPF